MGMEDFIHIVENVKNIDGKIIGQNEDMIKVDLAKTDKQAWVNHMVDQYLKHETIDTPPEEYKITQQDFVKEIARQEIAKIFSKG